MHAANDLKWLQHVDAISSKVSSKLYFLKQLKRSGAGPDDLLYFYVMAIRPVLEYACPALEPHCCSDRALESLQRRVMRIIFPDNDYLMSLIFASVDTLETRREQLSGFSDGAFYGKRPAYTICSRINGTQPSQTDYVM